MSSRESILARRLLGAILLAALAASALGIGPAAIAPFRAPEAGAQQVTSANITSLNTSRDAWGNIFDNTTTLLVAEFADLVDTAANPSVNITFRLLRPGGLELLCEANISLTPGLPGRAVRVYSTNIVANATGIFYGNVSTGKPGNPVAPATRICAPYSAFNLPHGGARINDPVAIFQFVDNTTRPARVLKELAFAHIWPPSLVPDSLEVIRNVTHVNVSFKLLIPDLNAFWNFVDNHTTVFWVIGPMPMVENATFRVPSGTLSLIETGKNTGIFSGTATFPASGLVVGPTYYLQVMYFIDSYIWGTWSIPFRMPPVVTTDKAIYGPGERVTITVSGAAPGSDVVVAVFNPRGDLVFAGQGAASPAGTFTTSFTLPTTATEPFSPGKYTVRAQQDSGVTTTAFSFRPPLPKPIEVIVTRLTFLNGTPADKIVTYRHYLVHYSLTNNNPVPETFTVIFQVLDPAGTTVQIAVHALSLGPGQSTLLADLVVFEKSGNYTIKILIVRSLADLTPRGDPATLTVSVSGG